MNANTLIKSLVAGVFAVSAGMGFAADAAKPEVKPAAVPAPAAAAAKPEAAKTEVKPADKPAEAKKPDVAKQ